MTRRMITMMSLLLMTPLFARGRTTDDAHLPNRLEFGDVSLILNGAGVRTAFFIDAYVAGLYLERKTRDAERIVTADEPMAVRLRIVSSLITPERMEKALRDAFDQATDGHPGPIQPEIDRFIEAFKYDIRAGDLFDLVYLPGTGVQVYKNGTLKATAQGVAFKRACFATWLGEHPVQESLKKAMLGR